MGSRQRSYRACANGVTVEQDSPLPALRLRGGYRAESGKSKGGSGGKNHDRRRRSSAQSRGGRDGKEKSSDKRESSGSGVAFQDSPPTLDKLLDDPAVQDFATNLFSNPGFQAIANSMLSDQKNMDLLKSYAGINETTTAHDREELSGVLEALSLDSNKSTAVGAEAQSNVSAAAANATSNATNSSASAQNPLEGAGMEGLMEAMGEVAKGAMAAQWSHSKERQMREDPSLAALQDSPKVREMQAEIQANGPMAVLKYINDPEALEVIQKIIGVTMQ